MLELVQDVNKVYILAKCKLCLHFMACNYTKFILILMLIRAIMLRQAEGSGRKMGPGGKELVCSVLCYSRYGVGRKYPGWFPQQEARNLASCMRHLEISYMRCFSNRSIASSLEKND